MEGIWGTALSMSESRNPQIVFFPLDTCVLTKGNRSEVIPWTFEADGERAQKELWQELSEKFEELQTGSTKYLAN